MPLIARNGKLLRTASGLASSLDCCCGGTPCECTSGGECLPALGYFRNLRIVATGFPEEIWSVRTTGLGTSTRTLVGLDKINGTYPVPYFVFNGTEYVESEPGSFCGWWGATKRFLDVELITSDWDGVSSVTYEIEFRLGMPTTVWNVKHKATNTIVSNPLMHVMFSGVVGISTVSETIPFPCWGEPTGSESGRRLTNDPFLSPTNLLYQGRGPFTSGLITPGGNPPGGSIPLPDGIDSLASESGCQLQNKSYACTNAPHSEGDFEFSGYSVSHEILFD